MFQRLRRHDGEPCWLGLRRSFWLGEFLAILATAGIVAIYGWLMWNWSETARELEECREARAATGEVEE